MAYDPITKSDNPMNCSVHRWDRNPGGYMRSIGTVKYFSCNNCLATKVTWSSDVKDENGKWVKVTDERIVEPNFGKDS